MTKAFCAALRKDRNRCLTYKQLLKDMSEQLQEEGHAQRPLLSSTQRIKADHKFSLLPNQNEGKWWKPTPLQREAAAGQ